MSTQRDLFAIESCIFEQTHDSGHGRLGTLSSYSTMRDDCELLQGWRQGDRHAGDLLIDRYFADMSRFFRNKVCHPDDAMDLVGQTFLACTTSKDRFRGETSFRRFLYAIATNVLRSYIREKQKRCSEAVDFQDVCIAKLPQASPTSVVMANRKAQAFVDALRRLPLEDQILLEHRYFSCRSSQSIAELLEIPPATVRGRLMRARQRLRREVDILLPSSSQGRETSVEDLDTWARETRAHLGWMPTPTHDPTLARTGDHGT